MTQPGMFYPLQLPYSYSYLDTWLGFLIAYIATFLARLSLCIDANRLNQLIGPPVAKTIKIRKRPVTKGQPLKLALSKKSPNVWLYWFYINSASVNNKYFELGRRTMLEKDLSSTSIRH